MLDRWAPAPVAAVSGPIQHPEAPALAPVAPSIFAADACAPSCSRSSEAPGVGARCGGDQPLLRDGGSSSVVVQGSDGGKSKASSMEAEHGAGQPGDKS